jgi:hypothetical protein
MLYFADPLKGFVVTLLLLGRLLLLPDPAQPVRGGRDDERTARGLDHIKKDLP